jgi:hypothetical protein
MTSLYFFWWIGFGATSPSTGTPELWFSAPQRGTNFAAPQRGTVFASHGN